MSALDKLKDFSVDNLPDLDEVVMGALELLDGANLPETNVPFRRPLIIGSGNALATGRILFATNDAVFADESTYHAALSRVSDIDGVIIISASGGKHAVSIAERLQQNNLPVICFTNNPEARTKAYLELENLRVFPKNREPYTYNTSTYLSMIVADSGERMGEIKQFIADEVAAKLPSNFADYNAFTLLLPPQFADLRPMLRTKFDELFGPKLVARVFTTEEVKHAKTVVPDAKELFISFGANNTLFGEEENRLLVPLLEGGGYAAALATCYYTIGHIQKSHPPYFKENIVAHCQQASQIFNQEIKPIVD